MEWSYNSRSWKTKLSRNKKFLDTFYFQYGKLATVKIWGQLNKFPLTGNSLKCLLLVKNCFEKTALKMFSCFANKLRPQTQSTGKFTSVVRLLVFCIALKAERSFCFFFLEGGGAKWGRQEWERPLESNLERLGGKKKVSKRKHGSFKRTENL